MSRGQYNFAPLNLKGNERIRMSMTDHICNMHGCYKYINAGDDMIRWGSFDLHPGCAVKWCESHDIEPNFKDS